MLLFSSSNFRLSNVFLLPYRVRAWRKEGSLFAINLCGIGMRIVVPCVPLLQIHTLYTMHHHPWCSSCRQATTDYCSMQRVEGRIAQIHTVRCTVAHCSAYMAFNFLNGDKSLVMSLFAEDEPGDFDLWDALPFLPIQVVLVFTSAVCHGALVTSHGDLV